MRWGRESGFTCIQVETVADLPTTVLEITASSSLAKELPSRFFVLVGLFSRQKREELAQKVAEERSRREEEARQLEAELAREREEQLRRQEEERAQREREEMERIRKQVAGSGSRWEAGRLRSPGSGWREGAAQMSRARCLACGEERSESPVPRDFGAAGKASLSL